MEYRERMDTEPEAPDGYRIGPRLRVVVVRDADPLPYFGQPIRGADDVWRLLREEAALADRERFLVVALNGRHRVIGVDEASVGSATASIVHPREVFKTLFLANACAFILVHNHPSGDPTPSREDRDITKRLAEVGELHGVKLLDHVIVTGEGFHSFADSGEL